MKYRLRKNLPCAKAGEIFREDFDEKQYCLFVSRKLWSETA